jgi:polysaccharide deacetylase family protein (PEP-CTERM system associated)
LNNALSFDIEDWFQVENLKGAISAGEWDRCELRVASNTERILSLLRESGTRATFFVLGWIAERCDALIREIDREGHEIASHGYGHQLVYEMEKDAFREDIRKSKGLLESITGKKVYGYRAPSFSITPRSVWALDVLKEEGMTYDSSIFPLSFHDRYGFPGCDGRPFYWPNGLYEIPLAVYRIGGFPLPLGGGGYFRLLPYFYFRFFLKRINRSKRPFIFYLHPWEFDPGQPKVKVSPVYAFRHYVNLRRTHGQLKRLLRDFDFDRVDSAYRLRPGA